MHLSFQIRPQSYNKIFDYANFFLKKCNFFAIFMHFFKILHKFVQIRCNSHIPQLKVGIALLYFLIDSIILAYTFSVPK